MPLRSPRVVSTAVLIRAQGEQFAINFKGDRRDTRHALMPGVHARSGERVSTTTAWVDRVHVDMVGDVSTDVQRKCDSLMHSCAAIHLLWRQLS